MRNRILLWSAVVAALCIAWVGYHFAWRASRGGEESPLYSSHRYDPYGTAALRTLLQERGTAVTTLERPRLTSSQKGVLIQVLPVQVPFMENIEPSPPCARCGMRRCQIQNNSLRDWVAAGNTVVQFTCGQTDLMNSIGITPPSCNGLAQDIQEQQREGTFPKELDGAPRQISWQLTERISGNMTEQAHGRFTLRAPRAFESKATCALHPIAEENSQVLAAECVFGSGRIVFIGSPSPVLNMNLGKTDNLDFLLALIGNDPVILDEWSHGIGNAGTVMGLIREYRLFPLLLQIAFVLALYFWSTCGHKRTDGLRIVQTPSSTEQIRTLGHLYSQCLSNAQKHDRVLTEAISRIARAVGASMNDLSTDQLKMKPSKAKAVHKVAAEIRALDESKHRWSDAYLAKMLTLSHDFAKENTHDGRIS